MSRRRWVLATDGSEAAQAAQDFLLALPLDGDFEITVVTVVADKAPLMGPYMEGVYSNWRVLEEVRKSEREAAERLLETTAQTLAESGAEIKTCQRIGDPGHQILALADELDAECIVVGSRGLTGLERFLLGSVARNVARHSSRPVIIARAPRHGLRRVLVTTDGSDHSRDAAQFLAVLPLPQEAEVRVVNVVRLYDPFPGVLPMDREDFRRAVEEVRAKQQQAAERFVREASETIQRAGKQVRTEILGGDPADEVLRTLSEWEADLLVMGARGVSAIERLLVGSVADRLLKKAECSVLIAH